MVTMVKMRLTVLLLLHIFLAALLVEGRNDAGEFLGQAIKLMEESPLLDTHIDLPQIIRSLCKNKFSPPHQTNALRYRLICHAFLQIDDRWMGSLRSTGRSRGTWTFRGCEKGG